MDVATHHRGLPASHYSRMLGGGTERVAAQDRQLFEKLELGVPSASGGAVDLDCGPGPQALALADMGFGSEQHQNQTRPRTTSFRAAPGKR